MAITAFNYGNAFDGQFRYRFIADRNGLFATSYTISATGIPTLLGVSQFRLGMNDITAGTNQFLFTAPTTSGGPDTLSFSLTEGHEYLFTLSDNSNLSGTIAGRSMTHTIALDWSAPINDAVIASVPAPGGLALFGIGLVALGRARRNRAA